MVTVVDVRAFTEGVLREVGARGPVKQRVHAQENEGGPRTVVVETVLRQHHVSEAHQPVRLQTPC